MIGACTIKRGSALALGSNIYYNLRRVELYLHLEISDGLGRVGGYDERESHVMDELWIADGIGWASGLCIWD